MLEVDKNGKIKAFFIFLLLNSQLLYDIIMTIHEIDYTLVTYILHWLGIGWKYNGIIVIIFP